MNHLNLKIFLIEIISIIGIILNIIFFHVYDEKVYILFFLIMYLFIKIFIGLKKDKTLNKVDYIQKIFIYNFIFLGFIYLCGLVLGYLKSGYNLDIISIFKNISLKIIIIIISEIIRYNLVIRNNKISVKTLIIILFLLFDILTTIKSYPLTNFKEILFYISLIVIPSFSKNFFLTYVISKIGYKPTILYRLILELYIYVLPIEPDLGEYLYAIIQFLYPMILFFRFYNLWNKDKVFIHSTGTIFKYISLTIISIIVLLVSGLFKYYLVSIGSNSMRESISIGDAVIIKKTNDNINEEDIVAYKFENRIIVHRVYKKKNLGSNILYQTKGDNNESPDNYYITKEDIIGKIIYKIPYIGIPSVWLSKIIERQ